MTILLSRQEQDAFQQIKDENPRQWRSRLSAMYALMVDFHPNPDSVFADGEKSRIAKAWDGEQFVVLFAPTEEYVSDADSDSYIPPFHLETVMGDGDGEDYGKDDNGAEFYANSDAAFSAAERISQASGLEIAVCNAVNGWIGTVFTYDEDDMEGGLG